MIHTPKAHLTDAELVLEVLNADDATWTEIELTQRLEQLMYQIEDMKEHIAVLSIQSSKRVEEVEGVPV